VVSVGDELLLGETVDTNGAWMARVLSEVGFAVVGRWVVGDEDQAIREAVEGALESTELVLVMGGLGPTPDDRTREAVADLLGVTLVPDPGLLEVLRGRMRGRGFGALPEGARAMARVPREGGILPNVVGAAPGLVMEGPHGRICLLLPGVPREMRTIVREEAVPYLRSRWRGRLRGAVHRTIHTFGIPESILQERVEGRLPPDRSGVSLAYLPDTLGVRLRLTARTEVESKDFPGEGPADGLEDPKEEALGRLRAVEALLEPVLAGHSYEAETGDLAEAVAEVLLQRRLTLGVAESCTGGLVAKRLTDVPGSSGFFMGGIVAYANEIKSRVLGIHSRIMEERGVVSEAVAAAMAEGVARALGTRVGIGVTGIAGPEGGTPEKPVGTVCFAIALPEGTTTRREWFPGDRKDVRERSAQAALGLLLRLLEREGS
jgi:nicotinamide-nucleotide amidase